MPSIWTMGEILVEIMRPRPDMPLSEPGEFLGPYPSGAPAIFIDAVARLGREAGITGGIVGGVGQDAFGRCVLDRLQADGVDCSNVRELAGRATAVAFVTYFADGSRRFIYHIDGTPAVEAAVIHEDALGHPDCFHVMGCSLMASDDLRRRILDVMAFAHKHGARISFDPNIRPELLGDRTLAEVVGPVLDVCSVLLPGVAELALLGGSDSIAENVDHLFAAHPLDLVVLKRGKQGCTVYTRDDRHSGGIDIPAYAIDEVDPTGAGDCFDAGYLVGLLEGRPLHECARMAAAAGALNTAAFGPLEGYMSRKRVLALMGERP